MSIRKRLGTAAWVLCMLTVVAGPFIESTSAKQGQAGAGEPKIPGPMKIYVGFPAGGQSDILARVVGDKLKDLLGTPVVVENRTGAAGRLAVEAVKGAPADGTALVLANIAQMGVAPLIHKDLPYDSVKDFTPISKAVDFQIALTTGKQTGAQDFKALLDWLKANPDKGTSGNPGNGSLPHLYGFELAAATGSKLQPVPYRGGAPIVAALMQGELAMGWAGIADFIEQHRAGQVRIVAVSGTARSPQLGDVPTFAELGYPTVSGNGWIGFFGPAGMSNALISRLQGAIAQALQDAEARKRLEGFGFLVVAGSPDLLRDQLAADLKKWKPVVEKAGITP